MAREKQNEYCLSSTGRGKDNLREGRKREQNRLSQRYLREKRILRSRQAASMEEAIKYSTLAGTADDKDARISQLGTQLLQATARNKRLSEGLLKMRNKFLSIGVSSNAAADNEIFDEILGLHSDTPLDMETTRGDTASAEADRPLPGTLLPCSASEQQPSLIVCDSENEPLSFVSQNSENLVPYEFNFDTVGDGSYHIQEIFDAISNTPCKSDNRNLLQVDHGSNGCSSQGGDYLLRGRNLRASPLQPIHRWPQLCLNVQSTDAEMTTSVDTPLLPIIDHLLPLEDSNTPLIQCVQPCSTSQLVEETCIKYASQLSGIKTMSESLGRVPDPTKSNEPIPAVAIQQIPEKIVDSLIKVAVYLITLYSNVEHYVYGLGIDKVMEPIIRWRISPSRDTAAAIPAPFCPTPLQVFGPAHNSMIDCCVWPSLRDQLILHHLAYDMEKLSGDMVRCTVLEIPHLKSAVNVMDLFFSIIIPKDNGNGIDHPALHGSCDITENSRPDGVDQSLLQEMIQRMPRRTPSDHYLNPLPARSILSAKLGLNDFHNWKLSKDFAEKYPFLDCISAESKYPTIPAATVVSVGLWVLNL